ncbi:hypothetical protein RIF29_13630 [Crotalaria pallida]|uniref:Uncharacterized protein n=1 Tax=Crotalaria pallida TaxID=3830 RepID=A0AAN9IPI7_CROPI
MLELFFTVAFSAVPLILYVPPIRCFNLFIETMEDMARESRTYTNRVSPRLRVAWSRIMDCFLCNTRSELKLCGQRILVELVELTTLRCE